jgi:outer membrane murein-binding lipoprotein Lpp
MDSSTVAGLLHVISSAVTPVVMISACASLILTINSKHQSISDRIRSIATEVRGASCTAARRKQLIDELNVFQRRFRLTYVAHVALNIAVIVFVLTVILIIFTQRRLFESGAPTLGMFLSGTLLMFVAMCCELLEISLSTRSMQIEIEDIVSQAGKSDPPPPNPS